MDENLKIVYIFKCEIKFIIRFGMGAVKKGTWTPLAFDQPVNLWSVQSIPKKDQIEIAQFRI